MSRPGTLRLAAPCLLWALLGGGVLAQAVSPCRPHGIGAARSDLEPLETYIRQADIPESRTFLASWEAGVQQMHAGHYERAVELLSAAVYSSPTHPTASFVYALALLPGGRHKLAAGNLQGAIGLYPGWRNLRLDLSEFYASRVDYTLVRDRLIREYDQAPRGVAEPEVLALLGTLFYFEGETQKARTALTQLRLQEPTDRVANHFLPRLEDPRMPPGPPPAGTRRAPPPEDPFEAGAALLYRGQYEQAFERFAQVLVADPSHPYAFFEMGQALFGLGRYRHAVATIREGLDRNPDILAAGLQRRQFYDAPERFLQEIEALEKAIRDDPDDADLIFLLGFQLSFDGETSRAVTAMRLVHRLRAGDRHAAMVLKALLERGTERAGSPPETPSRDTGATPDGPPPLERGDPASPGEPGEPATPPEPGEGGTGDPGAGDAEGPSLVGGSTPLPALAWDDSLGRLRSGDAEGAYVAYLQRMLAGNLGPVGKNPLIEDAGFILAAVQSGRVRHAVTLCDSLLRAHPEPDHLPLDLRDLYGDDEDLLQAIADLEDLSARAPDDLGLCTLLGFLLHYAGAPTQARKVFREIQARLPEHPHARAFLAH